VQVLFFGLLKEIVGRSEDRIEVPPGGRLQDVFEYYAKQFPHLKDLAGSIVLARNQTFSSPAEPIADGDEVAFLPPVSGGSGYTHRIQDPDGSFFALTRDPIRTCEIKRQILTPSDGAVVDFEGVVRNNTKGRPTMYLDYECYEAMAVKMMAELGREIRQALPITRIALVHRLGRMEIGEASVVVVASAAHRKPAFDAALDGINRLKKTVPIWKKEYFADGEVWVEGDWDEARVNTIGRL
jgi:molybdopterin synthase catalytic subunit